MKILFISLLLINSLFAKAETNILEHYFNEIESIDFGIKSTHLQDSFEKDANKTYFNFKTHRTEQTDWKINENNYGLIFNLKNNFSVGVLKNSFYNTSFLFGYNYDIYKYSDFSFKTKFYLITGYDRKTKISYNNGFNDVSYYYQFSEYPILPALSFDLQYKIFKVAIIPDLVYDYFNPLKSTIYLGLNFKL